MGFEIVSQNEYLLVKLLGPCEGDDEQKIDKVFKAKQEETKLKLAVFNCSECSGVSALFLRQLATIYKELEKQNGKMRLVGANDSVIDTIQKNGLDRILVCKMSLRGALVDFGLATSKEFDVNFINPFLNATQKVFKVQAFIEARPGKPSLKKMSDPLLMGDISGIISIASETFKGTLAISMPEAMFLKILKNMLGTEQASISEDVVDLVGELANIILGQAKIELASLGYRLDMALPSCVWGKDHKIKHFGGGVCIVIPFETDSGTFYTEVMTNTNLTEKMGTPKVAKGA